MRRSIRGRLLGLGLIWLTAALLGAFVLIAGLLEDFVTDRFDAETAAVADSLSAQLEVDDDGRTRLDDEPTDPRFDLPLTGWYWQVETADQVIARSPSLLDGRLGTATTPPPDGVGGHGFGADGAALRVMRRGLTIPDGGGRIIVTVTSPQDQIDASLRAIVRPLGIALAVLGAGLALASVVQVTVGLQSLGRLRDDLARVRAGKADRLALPEVSELQPLTREINESLDQNAALLARARQHLGNLAHSLKTPLSALANDMPADHPGQSLIARMDRLIGWHLRRARSSGPGVLGQRSLVAPVIDDILLVLRWPMTDKGMAARVTCPKDAAFAGERQDLEEMLGNLCDNAVKWGRSMLSLSVTLNHPRVIIRIEDDRQGMDDAQASLALVRGGRLDEYGLSGSGLGLAIVADLAALHGGTLRLEQAKSGGLAAVLDLPG